MSDLVLSQTSFKKLMSYNPIFEEEKLTQEEFHGLRNSIRYRAIINQICDVTFALIKFIKHHPVFVLLFVFLFSKAK